MAPADPQVLGTAVHYWWPDDGWQRGVVIFALTIDSVTIFHRESPHSRALQHEASILNALDEMPADEFRTELRETLTAFYETYLLRAGAGGRPVAKALISNFKVKAAPVPDAAAAEAGDAVSDPPDDAAALAAAAAAAPAAAAPPDPATPPAKRGKPTGGRSGRTG